jgi:purine-nucleoside phosphorylase
MTAIQEDLQQTVKFIRGKTSLRPSIALVLGSGLGDFADSLQDRCAINSLDIPKYPRSTVEGHKGSLVFGTIGRKAVVTFQGRVHLYESGNLRTVCYPIEVAHELGAQLLVVTNAAGGINRDFSIGGLMVIIDQVNLTGDTIQGGVPTGARLIYDPILVAHTRAVGATLGLAVRPGVYAGVRGPSYETAAEVEMLHRVGADAVGMSTVLEVELAYVLKMRVMGISCITNMATGIGDKKLTHDDVRMVANRVKKDFALLLNTVIEQL